jgi:peptidoglycan/LPS O-acetylase OafA/YrhL
VRKSDSHPRPGFRPDVEGLRAVAVVTVLLCHAGVPLAEGGYAGVDVFFVISGFVITRLLLTELERDGRLSLTRFYARRAKRLLPLAATVVAVTLVLSSSQAFTTAGGAGDVSRDAIAAGVYVANWHFAAEAADYFASPDLVSPLQHFWSLAVEEQFYLVWPALLLALMAAARLAGRAQRRHVVAAAVVTLGALSLVHA